jgi:hypothetical protein
VPSTTSAQGDCNFITGAARTTSSLLRAELGDAFVLDGADFPLALTVLGTRLHPISRLGPEREPRRARAATRADPHPHPPPRGSGVELAMRGRGAHEPQLYFTFYTEEVELGERWAGPLGRRRRLP